MFIFVVDRFEAIFTLCTRRTLTQATEGLWKTRALGGEGHRHPSFQDTNSSEGDAATGGEHERWVLSQNAAVRAGRTVLRPHTN